MSNRTEFPRLGSVVGWERTTSHSPTWAQLGFRDRSRPDRLDVEELSLPEELIHQSIEVHGSQRGH